MGNCASPRYLPAETDSPTPVKPKEKFKEGLIYMSASDYYAHVVDSFGYKFGQIASKTIYEGPVYLQSNGHFFAHGVGRIILPSGETYKGQFRNGVPHGYGEATYRDHSSYLGEWKNGFKHGKGCLYWPGGHQFEGRWDMDLRHGYGQHTDASGEGCLENWHQGVQCHINEFD